MIQDPPEFQAFIELLGSRDPKTTAAYLSILRDFVNWLADRPGGFPFRMELLTETAVRGYMDWLTAQGRAPRTRSKALTAIRRYCRWAVDEGLLRRNPASQIERPTVVAMSPRELDDDQRYVLKTLVEMSESKRLAAIIALGYWAGLRISEVATLKMEHCDVNQRSGVIIIVDGKGGKTRTLDLHNMARRMLYDYLYENKGASDGRDPESEFVFTSQRAAWLRSEGRADNLSDRAIQHIWSGLKEQATKEQWALIEDLTFHDLRHDWAHRARAAGWTLEEIAVYAGHQTKDGAPAISTTAIYTLPSRQQIKQRLQDLAG
jgi:site-specific recombinase XerD